MPQNCPHCGIALPAVVDAFCPECREDLSETPESLAYVPPPAPPVVPGPPTPTTREIFRAQSARIAPWVTAIFLVLAALRAATGDYVDAFITCGIAGLVLLSLARTSQRLKKPEQPEQAGTREPRKKHK